MEKEVIIDITKKRMEKKAKCEPLTNARELVKFINSENLSKDDILTVLDSKGQLLLIYFE